MATSVLANLVDDGLVAGYDTGYGVSTGDVANTSTYLGRPTTNLIPNASKMLSWGSYSNGNDGTIMTEFGTVGYTMNKRNSWNGLFYDVNLGSTGTYTFSGWYRYLSGTSSNNGATCYVSGYGGSDTASGINKSLVGQWQRISRTVTATSTTARFYAISYGGSSSTDYSSWQFTMPQVEAGSARSPFSDTVSSLPRTSTTSLRNIGSRNTVFTLATSYDSNGLPTFDGTDDYIDLSNNPNYEDPQASWEFVVKFDVVHDNETSTYRQLYIQEASIWIAQYYDYIGFDMRKDNNAWYDGNGGTNTGSQIGPVSSGTWYHGVFTWDGSNVRGYLNGSLEFTYAVSGATGILNGTTPRRFGRRSSQPLDGELPVFRIYNKALSADEISKNFNVYKERFNI